MLDLDSNVTHYALQAHTREIDAKFGSIPAVPAHGLEPDQRDADPARDAQRVIEAFHARGKELYFMELTTDDIRQLGFFAIRVWSPDILGLCLPSAPPQAHDRYAAYGGFANDAPHPYP